VGAELGTGDARVAQDRLDVAQVRMVTEHLGGHRVTKGMGRYRLGHVAPLRRSPHDLPDCPNGNAAATVKAHKEPLLFIPPREPRPRHSEVSLDEMAGMRTHIHHTGLSPLWRPSLRRIGMLCVRSRSG